jgi:hypothetical protein
MKEQQNKPAGGEHTAADPGQQPGVANQVGRSLQDEPDISTVDQQEGNMNNGALGGNFGEASGQQPESR